MNNARRSACPVSCALDLIGDRWTLLIVRDLALGRQYFKEFLASPEGIATNVLTDRLNRLLAADLVQACPSEERAGRNAYKLTAKGETLLPLLQSVADWGLRHIEGTRYGMQREPSPKAVRE